MVSLATVSLLFGIVATAAGVLVPERMQVIVTLTSSLPVSEIMLPVGHWALAGIWMLTIAMITGADRRAALWRCLGVAIALHALILVTLFVGKLSDRDAFSATVYLLYAWLFCVSALASATAWAIVLAYRLGAATNPVNALEVPIAVGAAALAIALTGQQAAVGIIAVLAGSAIAMLIIGAPSATQRLAALRAVFRNELVFLACVFVAALALRLLYVQRIMGDPNYLDSGADGRIYDELAWSIAKGGGIPESFTSRFPLLLLGYVWFLAVIYKIFGHSYLAAVAMQSLIGSTTVLLIYLIGKHIFGMAVARVAALFTALNFSLIFAAASLGHQAVDVFLTALATVMLLRGLASGDAAWRWAAAGVVVGLGFAVRETAILFVAFAAAWIVLAHPRGWQAALRSLAAYTAGAAIVVVPFLAPKMSRAEDRLAMRGHFERMYRGEGEPSSTPRPDLISPVGDPGAALAQLQASPRRVVATLMRSYVNNFVVQFFTQPYGGFDLVFLRKGTDYYYAMWFYAYALTVAGAALSARIVFDGGSAARAVLLILGVIVSRTIPHLILVSNYRHRVPIEPFLILLASIGAVALWERVTVHPLAAARGDRDRGKHQH